MNDVVKPASSATAFAACLNSTCCSHAVTASPYGNVTST